MTMNESGTNTTNFYEMWSSIYTLEAILDTSPDRALKRGHTKMWRILWEDASVKITAYLSRTSLGAAEEESLACELLAAERSKLRAEIQKISTFNAEAGDAIWKNSASMFMASTSIRCLVQALRAYLELERRYLMPQKGATV